MLTRLKCHDDVNTHVPPPPPPPPHIQPTQIRHERAHPLTNTYIPTSLPSHTTHLVNIAFQVPCFQQLSLCSAFRRTLLVWKKKSEEKKLQSSGAVWTGRWACSHPLLHSPPIPNEPYHFCGCKAPWRKERKKERKKGMLLTVHELCEHGGGPGFSSPIPSPPPIPNKSYRFCGCKAQHHEGRRRRRRRRRKQQQSICQFKPYPEKNRLLLCQRLLGGGGGGGGIQLFTKLSWK